MTAEQLATIPPGNPLAIEWSASSFPETVVTFWIFQWTVEWANQEERRAARLAMAVPQGSA